VRDGKRRRHGGVRRNDNIIAGADPPRAQGKFERLETVGNADGKRGSAIRGKRALEFFDLRTADIHAGSQHAREDSLNLVAVQFVEAGEVDVTHRTHVAFDSQARNAE
jgi:hypothetical protein